jgi:hypothetical protein
LRGQEPNLQVRLAEVSVTGEANVEIRIDDEGEGVVSTMTANLSNLRFRHATNEFAPSDAGGLKLRAVARDPTLFGGFKDVSVNLELGPLVLADTRVLNAFLPESLGLEFLQGSFRVAANYLGEGPGHGNGRISIDSDEVGFQLGDRQFTGRLDASAQYQASTNELVRLHDATVVVTNVHVSGLQSRAPDGWFAAVEIDQGTIALDGSKAIAADASVHLLDIRPLLAVLRENEESASWARWIPNLKDLRGAANVKVEPGSVTVRDLAMRGKATEILAQMQIENGEPDGILYVRYGLISAGFDFRGDKRHWTILGAKRGYFRDLEEMRRTNSVSGGPGEGVPSRPQK